VHGDKERARLRRRLSRRHVDGDGDGRSVSSFSRDESCLLSSPMKVISLEAPTFLESFLLKQKARAISSTFETSTCSWRPCEHRISRFMIGTTCTNFPTIRLLRRFATLLESLLVQTPR
jgi:hypothetical protein